MGLIYHIAIEDDWEMSIPFGAYVAATRGLLFEPGGHIRAVTADGVQAVLDSRYDDLHLPLVLIELDTEELEAAGVPVDGTRILGPIPPGDPEAVRAVLPLHHDGAHWVVPALPSTPSR